MPITFEVQLETFRELGFLINKDVDLNKVVENWGGKKIFEQTPYSKLYIMLGSTAEENYVKTNLDEISISKNDLKEDITKRIFEHFDKLSATNNQSNNLDLNFTETNITDQLWNFDTEAIEDHGDYIRIIKNIKRITANELDFRNIKDFVDIEKNKAVISFDLFGKHYDWNLKVQNDWVDEKLFTQIVRLTHQYKTRGKLTYFDTGGQSFVMGYVDEDLFRELRNKTGLNIEWLK